MAFSMTSKLSLQRAFRTGPVASGSVAIVRGDMAHQGLYGAVFDLGLPDRQQRAQFVGLVGLFVTTSQGDEGGDDDTGRGDGP